MVAAHRRVVPWLVAVVMASLAFTACGSDDDETTTGGQADSSAVVEEAKASVEQATAPITEFNGPADSPPPAKDKHVFIVSCGPDTEACPRIADAAMEAIRTIGWRGTVLETDGSVQQFNTATRQAIQRNADGIILDAFPASTISQPLAEAKKQGIPVVGVVSGDDTPDTSGDFEGGLFTVADADPVQVGEYAADWILAETNGEAKVGTFTVSAFPVLEKRYSGFEAGMEDCSSCELVDTVSVELTALVKDGAPQTAQFLRANPDVNYMFSTFDGGAILAAQGIRTANSDVPMVSVDGNAPNLEMIREGGPQVAVVVAPLEWVAWAGIDQLNRAFNDEPPAPEWTPEGGGIPVKILTEENVPPSGEPFTGDLDFPAEFRELWNVGG